MKNNLMNGGHAAPGWIYSAAEHHLYGSSRLGVHQTNLVLASIDNQDPIVYTVEETEYTTFTRGKRNYELSNHLGNVQVVITDKRVSKCDSELAIEYFEAEVLTAMDYYPFGMLSKTARINSRNMVVRNPVAARQLSGMMPDRQWYANSDSSNYRFGFNGMERDNEVSGQGNNLDFGARIYDSRLGRWLSVDPLYREAPQMTPYNYAINSPLLFIDPDGLWVKVSTTDYYKAKDGTLTVIKWYNIFKKTVERETKIVMGDVKIYNHYGKVKKQVKVDGGFQFIDVDPTREQLTEMAQAMKKGLLEQYGNKSAIDPDNPEICVSVSLELQGDFKVIHKLSEAKEEDELIILINNIDENYQGEDENAYSKGKFEPDEADGWTHSGSYTTVLNIGRALNDPLVYSHEWTHQRYNTSFKSDQDHGDGGIYDYSQLTNTTTAPNFLNLWNLFRGSDNCKSSDRARFIYEESIYKNKKP